MCFGASPGPFGRRFEFLWKLEPEVGPAVARSPAQAETGAGLDRTAQGALAELVDDSSSRPWKTAELASWCSPEEGHPARANAARAMRVLILLLLLFLPVLAETEPPDWRWAPRWTLERVLARPEAFLDDFVRGERPFFRATRHPQSGLTYDGWNLDPLTGSPIGPRLHSAPSKECLDVAILTKAILGDRRALMLVDEDEAVDILRRKLQSYRDWTRRYPRSGGYMPWWYGGHSAEFTPSWNGAVPALDNGEWVWTMLVAEKALRDRGYARLAEEYHEFNDQLMDASARIFYDDEKGRVRGDVRVDKPPYVPDPGKQGYLDGEHGVHEGVMMVMFVTLFGKDLPPDASQRIWSGTNMVRVETPWGTTWQGFWGSSHEEWAYLFMPYFELPEYRKLFTIRQVIRTQNAAMRGYRGLHASIHDPVTGNYVSDCGIEGVGTQKLKAQHALALYGAFPVLMADRTAGSAWLYNMLCAPRMQGPMGGGESVSNDGRHAMPVKTIDGTFPLLLAAMGGFHRETAATLRERGVLEEFKAIMREEYREAFGDLPLRREADFALPPSPVPWALPDYAW